MIHDDFVLSLEQAGTFYNVVGTFVPMIIALAVALFYHERYFRYWTLSYAFIATGLFLDIFFGRFGRPFAFSTFLGLAHVLGTYYLFKVCFSLEQREPKFPWHLGIAVGTFALAEVFMVQGQPFEKAIMPSLAANLLAHLTLGWTLFKIKSPSKVRAWLAALSLGIGIWGLTYPILVQAHVVWLGYFIIGTMHLLIGVGMALFLFETNAQTLSAKNAELTRLDRLKNNFISTMSHEFRTPLSAIRSASWYSMRAEPSQREEINTIIVDNVERITSLINDVLDYSKMETGLFVYEYRSVDVVSLIEEVVRRLRGAFEEKSFVVSLVGFETPKLVDVDAYRLGQVIENLLSNACKFTPSGGRITVRLATDHDDVTIQVADTGVGIPDEEMPLIFTKFYQVESNSTRKVGGAGLGLAITRAIVEDGHRGTIRATSQPGEGSVFTVRLPKHQDQATSDQPVFRTTGNLI